jgi:restriction endonuclease Mrr
VPILIEKVVTNRELEKLLDDALTEPLKPRKGYKFELFFESLMIRHREFKMVYKHSRSRLGEVDYVFRNEVKDPFWQMFPYVCIECKNWEKKISSKEMDHFVSLIKDKSPLCHFGVFVTSSFFEVSAKTSMNNARIGDKITIVPIEGDHLKDLINDGFENCVRKVCEETVFKKGFS